MLGSLIALLCMNATQFQTDLAFQDLAEVERLIGRAKFREARELLERQRHNGALAKSICVLTPAR